MQKDYYSVEEIAEILGVHPDTVRGWIRDKKLPAVRVGNYRVSKKDFDKFIQERKTVEDEHTGEK
jgi:excisionase family DNA binding protein